MKRGQRVKVMQIHFMYGYMPICASISKYNLIYRLFYELGLKMSDKFN